MDAPAAAQMGVLKKIFLARKQWWLLVPDQSIFESGGRISDAPLPIDSRNEQSNTAPMSAASGRINGGKPGPNELLHLAARHKDGHWAMLYLADKASFSVNMNKLSRSEAQCVLGQPDHRRVDADWTRIEHRREVVHNARRLGRFDLDPGGCRDPLTSNVLPHRINLSHSRRPLVVAA